MAFRNNAYATVWDIKPVVKEDGSFAACTDVRLSTSRKKPNTNPPEYETDFSGFVRFIGDAHKMAAGLRQRDRIRLDEVSATNTYYKETGKIYYNFQCYAFSPADGARQNAAPARSNFDAGAGVTPGMDDNLPFE